MENVNRNEVYKTVIIIVTKLGDVKNRMKQKY